MQTYTVLLDRGPTKGHAVLNVYTANDHMYWQYQGESLAHTTNQQGPWDLSCDVEKSIKAVFENWGWAVIATSLVRN